MGISFGKPNSDLLERINKQLTSIRLAQANDGHSVMDQTNVGFPPEQFRTPLGVVTVIHGLNNRSSNMEPFVQHLQSQGFVTVNVGLTGHGQNPQKMQNVSLADWIKDAENAQILAQSILTHHKLDSHKNFLLAFSLGALAAQLSIFAANQNTSYFGKQFLLAPAFSIQFFTNFLTPLFLFPKVMIPSLNIPKYRSSAGTSVAAYQALFSGVSLFEKNLENFKSAKKTSPINVPTKILLSEDDEFVSFSGTRSLIRQGNLSAWTLEKINVDGSTLPKKIQHLLIAEESFNKESWRSLLNNISDFFKTQ